MFWILAVIITFAAIIYQRKTGPTYDKKVSVSIDNQPYKFKLIRSHGGTSDCNIELNMPDMEVEGILSFKKYLAKLLKRDKGTKAHFLVPLPG